MMGAVIDTNVIVSAALSPNGNPAKIITLIATDEDIQLYYSQDILSEYKDVLSRERLKISTEKQSSIISAIQQIGILIEPIISTIPLPDESDRVFYDTAKTVGAILITGNTKHYPVETFIMTPSDFFMSLRGCLPSFQ